MPTRPEKSPRVTGLAPEAALDAQHASNKNAALTVPNAAAHLRGFTETRLRGPAQSPKDSSPRTRRADERDRAGRLSDSLIVAVSERAAREDACYGLSSGWMPVRAASSVQGGQSGGDGERRTDDHGWTGRARTDALGRRVSCRPRLLCRFAGVVAPSRDHLMRGHMGGWPVGGWMRQWCGGSRRVTTTRALRSCESPPHRSWRFG